MVEIDGPIDNHKMKRQSKSKDFSPTFGRNNTFNETNLLTNNQEFITFRDQCGAIQENIKSLSKEKYTNDK